MSDKEKAKTTYLAMPKALRAYLVMSTYEYKKIEGRLARMNLVAMADIAGSI